MTPSIRSATRDELALMIEWAEGESWNPGLEDLDPFWNADPDGYWVCEVDGKIAATLSVVRHDPQFAFLGFYIASPAFRGRGIAFALWTAVLERTKATTVALDGVVSQQQNYARSGFSYAHANIRLGGGISINERADPQVHGVQPGDLPALLALDQAFNPGPRTRLMRAWLTDTDTRKTAVLRENGRITGFGTIRKCGNGHKIGPLFAGDEHSADRLFRHLVGKTTGGMIYLDVPEPNRLAFQLGQRYGLQPVFETARMYRGVTPDLPLRQIFGITSFELG